MEDEHQETEKSVDIRREDRNRSQSPPRNFSFKRRSEIYYFSNDSARGILKRVPVENGAYKINELETVLEKYRSAKTANEILSDILLSNLGSSKAFKNDSAAKSDILSESSYHDQERGTICKLRERSAVVMSHSHGLNIVAGKGAHEDNSETIGEYQDQMTVYNKAQNDMVFLKSFEETERHQSCAFVETDCENLLGQDSGEKHKKFSASMKSNSSQKPEELKSSNEYLSDTRTEKSLSDVFSNIKIKSLVTEL